MNENPIFGKKIYDSFHNGEVGFCCFFSKDQTIFFMNYVNAMSICENDPINAIT